MVTRGMLSTKCRLLGIRLLSLSPVTISPTYVNFRHRPGLEQHRIRTRGMTMSMLTSLPGCIPDLGYLYAASGKSFIQKSCRQPKISRNPEKSSCDILPRADKKVASGKRTSGIRHAHSIRIPKVFVTRPDIPQAALDLLKESCDVVTWSEPTQCPRKVFLESVRGINGIYCTYRDSIDEELLAAAGPTLKVVATMSVGHEHIDMTAAKARGVRLGYTPEILTDATAELTVGVLVAASRRLFEAHQAFLNGDWERNAWGPTWMMGMGLANSTVGIYGMGRIGQGVMKRLSPFGVSRFLYSGRTKRNDVPGATYVDFDDLCRLSDFVICTAALSPETREVFNGRAFGLMKPNCVFVNASRGGLVRQEDLISALKENKIFGAGLDVMTPEPLPVDHELTKLRNCAFPYEWRKWADSGGNASDTAHPHPASSSLILCLFVSMLILNIHPNPTNPLITSSNGSSSSTLQIVIPHIGSSTVQTRLRMGIVTAQNILAGIKDHPLPHELI